MFLLFISSKGFFRWEIGPVLAHHLAIIERSKEVTTYTTVPYGIRKVASDAGVHVTSARIVTFKYGEIADELGYGHHANQVIYATDPRANVPGRYLVLQLGRGGVLDFSDVRGCSHFLLLSNSQKQKQKTKNNKKEL